MHALAKGLLIAVTYLLVEKSGLLEGKTLDASVSAGSL